MVDLALLVLALVLLLPSGELEYRHGVIFLACYAAPVVLGHWLWGKTPGKALFGIRVIDATGRNPGILRSAARWLVEAVPTLSLLVAAVAVAIAALFMQFFASWEDSNAAPVYWFSGVFGALVIGLAFPALNLIVMLASPHQRTVPDYVAKTWVVRD